MSPVYFVKHVSSRTHRNTARRYLEELVEMGILEKHKVGKENFYLNKKLVELLKN